MKQRDVILTREYGSSSTGGPNVAKERSSSNMTHGLYHRANVGGWAGVSRGLSSARIEVSFPMVNKPLPLDAA